MLDRTVGTSWKLGVTMVTGKPAPFPVVIFGAPKRKYLWVTSSPTAVELGFSSIDKYINGVESNLNFFAVVCF